MVSNDKGISKAMSNRRTLLILGNGFDLDLGLKTSFRDFLNSSSYSSRSCDTATFRLIEDKENWGDIEGVLRKAVLNSLFCHNTSIDEEINQTWQLLRNGWGIYLPQYIDDVQKTIKQWKDSSNYDESKTNAPIITSSCAYSIAKRIVDWSAVFSFNYTNPADLLFGIWPNDIHFIHNTFIPHKHSSYPMYQIANFLAIGIDSKRINEQLIDREYLLPIIKLNFMKTSLLNELNQTMIEADNIIFFGHSMSITDSDYFNDFFNGMAANSITDKRLFFVTKNQKTIDDIKNNLRTWEVDYDKLFKSKNCIAEVFTDYGPENDGFKAMLELV